MLSKQTTIAVVLSMMMVMSAGCAGWGTDGPTNPDEETDGNGEVQTNESPRDDQETELNDSGTEEEQQGSEENSNTSTSTDPTEESSTGEDTDGTDANGPSETEDGKTSDSTEETDTTDETETDSSQTDSDQSDESPSSNGGDDNGDGSPASGDNNENGGEEPSENGENGDSDESDGEDSSPNESAPNESQDPSEMSCDTFDTWDEAHSQFEQDMQAYSHLDGDGDGIPCEHLKEGGDNDTQGETHNLTVQVYDSEGNPVEGADVGVTVYDSGAPVDDGTTDENGQVTFEVPDGSYEVMVSGTEDAQATTDRGASVDGEDTTHVVNLYNPNDNMHRYGATIQVVDENGNPVANERVSAGPVDANYQDYITDENGEVIIEFGNSMTDDAVMYEAIVRGESHNFSIERGVQHERIVVSSDTERETHTLTVSAGESYGVEGVEVTLERHADGATTTKTTNSDGQATFEVYPGDYTVTGVDPRGEEESVDVTVPDQQQVALVDMAAPAPDKVETTLTVVDQDRNPVEGVTIEGMTSIPPHSADVYFESEPTDENGEVTVTLFEGQSYGSLVVQDEDGNHYDHGGQRFTTDGDEVTITVERPQQDSQQALVTA